MSSKSGQPVQTIVNSQWLKNFPLVLGAIIGLCLLKFGNPVILSQAYETPDDWLGEAWPLPIAYFLFAGILIYGFMAARVPERLPQWLLWSPVAWLGWQVLATMGSVSSGTSISILLHLAAVTAAFYLGLFALSRVENMRLFWLPVSIALALVLWKGFNQHYGGIDSVAQYIQQNEATGWKNISQTELDEWIKSGVIQKTGNGYTVVPEVLKRVHGGRISGTLVYANALAGIILLTFPAVMVVLWHYTEKLHKIARMVAIGLMLYMGVACLIWSGSKAGWLVAIAMILAGVLAQPMSRQWKMAILAVVLIGGIGGFFVKYSSYFKKGATSVSARMDYWQAAVKLTAEKPIFGQGPGTFSRGYARLKRPEAEMSKLAHNDYLQQACDSGIPGFLFFCAWVGGSLFYVWRRGLSPEASVLTQATALGVTGWALQSFVEFGLYIPAIGWTAMLLLGWTIGQPAPQTASTAAK